MPAIQYNAQLTTSDAAVITAGAGVTLAIKELIALNTTGGAVTAAVSVHRATSGTVETEHTASIAANTAEQLLDDVHLALEELVLEPGDSVHASAGAGTSITLLAF